MTDIEFNLYQEEKLRQYEALCNRCGACCGIYDSDHCSHLIATSDHKYICDIYENRFGLHQTKNGRYFLCVPIRDIIFKSWSGSWRCAYKMALSRSL